MRRALAGVVIVAFAGLLCTSLLALFSGNSIDAKYLNSHSLHYPYFIAY